MAHAMITKRALLASMGALALAGRSFAQASDFPALTAFLDKYVGTGRLSGVVVAFKRGSAPVKYLSRGVLEFGGSVPAGPDSIFRIYSMTKPVTGVAALRLIQDGQLKLDEPISKVLPEFRTPRVITDPMTMQTRPASAPITLRHLLTHTSGMSHSIFNSPLARLYVEKGLRPGRYPPLASAAGMPRVNDLEAFVERLSSLPLESEPGVRYQYSLAIELVGAIVQRVTGMQFYEYLKQIVFDPLAMSDTDFVVPDRKVDRFMALPHIENGEPAPYDPRVGSPYSAGRDIQSGSGGLVSTAQDYIKFVTMLRDGGQFEGKRVLSAEMVKLASSNLLPRGVVYGRNNGYGAGMSVVLPAGELPGEEPAGSYGWSGAAGTQMWTDPVNNLSFVLMVQYMPVTAYPVGREIRLAAYSDLKRM